MWSSRPERLHSCCSLAVCDLWSPVWGDTRRENLSVHNSSLLIRQRTVLFGHLVEYILWISTNEFKRTKKLLITDLAVRVKYSSPLQSFFNWSLLCLGRSLDRQSYFPCLYWHTTLKPRPHIVLHFHFLPQPSFSRFWSLIKDSGRLHTPRYQRGSKSRAHAPGVDEKSPPLCPTFDPTPVSGVRRPSQNSTPALAAELTHLCPVDLV